MSLYLDASVLVALFVEEASTAQAQARLVGETLLISDFAAATGVRPLRRRIVRGGSWDRRRRFSGCVRLASA